MPNPRGSLMFGQRLTDEIRDDWGGKAYQDLMKAVDHVLSLGYVDPSRLAAGGGSCGGYMVSWIAGHTDRFKCLVSHAGTFNRSLDHKAEKQPVLVRDIHRVAGHLLKVRNKLQGSGIKGECKGNRVDLKFQILEW